MSKFCPGCGEEISPKVKFCPECGADIDSFSVKKNEGSNIQDVKNKNKKVERKYSLYQVAIYGIIIIVILLLLWGVLSVFSAFSNGMQSNIHPSPKVTAAPTIVTTPQMVVATTQTGFVGVTPIPEISLPTVEITNQYCAPGNANFLGVSTVLKNRKNTTVSGDLVLKVYTEAGVLLGTFKQQLILPPNGDNWTGIILYSVDYRNSYSMSTEYPDLLQAPPPRETVSGYSCPAFRKA